MAPISTSNATNETKKEHLIASYCWKDFRSERERERERERESERYFWYNVKVALCVYSMLFAFKWTHWESRSHDINLLRFWMISYLK